MQGIAEDTEMKPANAHPQGAVSPGEDRHKVTVQWDKTVMEGWRKSSTGRVDSCRRQRLRGMSKSPPGREEPTVRGEVSERLRPVLGASGEKW